jgi:YD repeat-containing protein
LSSARSNLGTTNYNYDANDRLISEIFNNEVTNYTYDLNGNNLTRSMGRLYLKL